MGTYVCLCGFICMCVWLCVFDYLHVCVYLCVMERERGKNGRKKVDLL